MRRGNLSLIVLACFLAITLVSANSYSIEFTQVNDKIVVKEMINEKSIGSYVDQDLLDKSADSLYFVKKIIFNQSFDNVKLKFNLDTGVIIKDNLIFPAGYSLESNGQIITAVWNLKNVVDGQTFAVFITLEDTKWSSNWIYWLAGILVIIAVGAFVYWLDKKAKIKKIKADKSKPHSKKKKIQSEYDYLLDTEKKVIEELKKADRHELWQKQIQDSTGFSKAKVSRLIRNLESRGLIVKIPFGNTNKIRLK